LRSLNDVIGREAALAIAPGQVLDPQYLRNPVVVQRGEVVDVIVRSGGIKIETKARAREAGGVGDIVQVDLLHNKQALTARVSGPQTVEVLGGVGGN
jgi:flagella basal body P-ring formation protein FlgA